MTFFSLALLTKYNAVFLGIGALTYILYYKNRIQGPSYIHILLSAFLVFLIQMPVFLWNVSNDFASFSFHLSERLDDGISLLTFLKNIGGFIFGVIIAFSPVFIFNLKNFFSKENSIKGSKNFIGISLFVLIFSLAFCILLSTTTNILYYWFTPAVVLFVPFLINIIRSKVWQYLHIIYGTLISLILLINITVYPISAFFGNVDRETAILFGWKKITEIVEKEKRLRGIEKVIFSDYRLGSLYVFHSGDFEVDVVMEQRGTQFDIWRKKSNFSENTLIVTDKDFPIGQRILSGFRSISFLKDIEIYAGNKLLKKYQVFLGSKI